MSEPAPPRLSHGKVVKYYGGKSGALANWILAHFPTGHTIYFEPFGGSASMLFLQQSPIEIYNDLEGNVHALFKVLSHPGLFEQFKARCDVAFYSARLREEYVQRLKQPDLPLVDRAFCYFYVNRTSYHGIGGFSTNCAIRRNMAKCVSDFLAAVDRLPEFHQRLSRVIIHRQDALKLIEKFDKPYAFLYLDPPYHHSTRTAGRYPVDMDNDQQEELIDLLLQSKAKVLLSGYDCPAYQRLEKAGWIKKKKEFKVVDPNRKPKTKTEYLWMNYEIN